MAAKDDGTLCVKKWCASNIQCNTISLLVGKRGTGKTVLLQDLCYHMRDKIDYALGFSPTEDCNETLSKFIPDSMVYSEYREDVLTDLMDLQKRMWRIKGKSGYRVLIILDDCCYDKKILRSKVIREIFMNGRHRHVTLVIAVQYVMDMPPDLRTQVDYVFALRENVIKNRERLYLQFFGFFNKYKHFATVMDSCTENYECLVCDNKTSKENTIDACVFWYKAAIDLPEYRLGHKFTWKLHKFYYKKEQFALPRLPKLKPGGGGGKRAGGGVHTVIKHDERGKEV